LTHAIALGRATAEWRRYADGGLADALGAVREQSAAAPTSGGAL
jgi:hypothetical protein